MFAKKSISQKSFVLLTVIFMSLTGIQPVQAQSVFTPLQTTGAVWYVATIGNDTNDCITTTTPCTTINGAIGKAVDGDTIEVAVGTYTGTGTEVVLINKSVTLSGGWDATFTTQNGKSTIDGQIKRLGVALGNNIIATIERFVVQNGTSGISNSSTLTLNNSAVSGNFGTGIGNTGTLTLNNSTVSSNFGTGIHNGNFNNYYGTLTLNNSAVSGNTASFSGGGGIENSGTALTLNNSTISGNTSGSYGGGILNSMGTLTLNNSTVSDNTGSSGGGIFSTVTLTLNNSTVSGNTSGPYGGGGIENYGPLTLNNSTISNNQPNGFTNTVGHVILQNTIIAKNEKNKDCSNFTGVGGSVISQGYNLIGNGTDCTLTSTTGDQVGTSTNPIDPLLAPLQDNGGPTFTQALLGSSPALNAGNPAIPGSGGNACLATDQRGVARPVDTTCDIGAFEGYFTGVASIKIADSNPTNAVNVNFIVTFSEAVTGVNMTAPFSDFNLTTTGLTGSSITGISGSDSTYTVTVYTGSGSGDGTIRLDVMDDDSILDSSNAPLGGTGPDNGNFTAGEQYTLPKIPTPLTPANTIYDMTPTYKWSHIPGATKYQYQLIGGTKAIYAKIVTSSACGTTTCSNTPTDILKIDTTYKWRVRAMIGGEWKDYSAFKSFRVNLKPGLWSGPGLKFYVNNDLAAMYNVYNFSVYIYVHECHSYKKVSYSLPYRALITNRHFAFNVPHGPFLARGNFSTTTKANGQFQLINYYIPSCGYISGGPFTWSAKWKDSSQTNVAINDVVEDPLITLTPEIETPFNLFTIDPNNQ